MAQPQFNPPEWLIRNYMTQKSPAEEASAGIGNALQAYMQLRNTEQERALQKSANEIKRNELALKQQDSSREAKKAFYEYGDMSGLPAQEQAGLSPVQGPVKEDGAVPAMAYDPNNPAASASVQQMREFKEKNPFGLKGREKAEQQSTQAGGLRGQFINFTKDFADTVRSYQRIQNSASDPSPAGDLALIFNYMKMLDPGSTVREGEFANAENSGGIPDRIRAQYNKALSGERLSPPMRIDFVQRAGDLYKGQERLYRNTESQFRQLAKASNIPEDQVVFDMASGLQTPANMGRSAQLEFATPQEAEAANLPPGTVITIGGRRAVIE